MAHKILLTLGLLSATHALPSRWRNAVVQRGAADVTKEYDYIVGKFEIHSLTIHANTMQLAPVLRALQWPIGLPKMA